MFTPRTFGFRRPLFKASSRIGVEVIGDLCKQILVIAGIILGAAECLNHNFSCRLGCTESQRNIAQSMISQPASTAFKYVMEATPGGIVRVQVDQQLCTLF